MFGNLIESGSHARDLKRRSSFFLGTLVTYAALLAVAGVGSIYAYNARLEEPSWDDVLIMKFPPVQPIARPQERVAPRPAAAGGGGGGGRPQVAIVREISVHNPNLQNRPTASVDTPDVTARTPVMLGDSQSFVPARIGIPGDNPNSTGGVPGGPNGRGDGPYVPETEDAPPPRVVKPEPPPKKPVAISSVLNGKAVFKPTPVYTQIAKIARAQGTVTVQIVVDEEGRVISAHATGGHPLLRQESVKAACRARFTPTYLTGQPVKVSGFITYNFVLQ